ncbi:unnamed protein product, partial [Ectocarpus sp. 12 AP-2014]
VKPGGARLVAESPSPMPPPRSRARASLDNDGGDAGSAAAAATAAAAGAAAVSALAGGVFGVVVLLASEWVEVGSGLAEISMRADTWGNRLLASLLQEDDGHEGQGQPSGVNAVLPQLCRLGLHLSAREAQGARPPASIWDVLMRCADRRVSMSEEALFVGEEERSKTTCVQSFLAASVALEGRKDGMSSLVERLMAFMFTQAFISDEEQEQDGAKENADKGPSIDGLTRLEVRAMQDVDSDE